MTVIGFTGTQRGMTTDQADQLRRILVAARRDGAIWMRNGDCVGADEQAAILWDEMGGLVHLHPPIITTKRAFIQAENINKAETYLVRNRHIVDRCHRLFATPAEMAEQERGGTWYTIRYARRLGRPVTIVFPDGSVSEEGGADG